jgi:hypothetical protein
MILNSVYIIKLKKFWNKKFNNTKNRSAEMLWDSNLFSGVYVFFVGFFTVCFGMLTLHSWVSYTAHRFKNGSYNMPVCLMHHREINCENINSSWLAVQTVKMVGCCSNIMNLELLISMLLDQLCTCHPLILGRSSCNFKTGLSVSVFTSFGLMIVFGLQLYSCRCIHLYS